MGKFETLKFRAWYRRDIETSTYLPFYSHVAEGQLEFRWGVGEHSFEYNAGIILGGDDWAVESDTKIKDINGNDIFEGDIVKINTEDTEVVGHVHFLPQQNGYAVICERIDFPLRWMEAEVLGNLAMMVTHNGLRGFTEYLESSTVQYLTLMAEINFEI